MNKVNEAEDKLKSIDSQPLQITVNDDSDDSIVIKIDLSVIDVDEDDDNCY